jgi:hypothetical protein
MTVLALPRHLSPPPEEAAGALEALVREAVATGTPRQALLLRLSRLPRTMPHHLRLAVEALEPLTAADRARLFLLPNGDAAVVWRGPAPTLLAEARTRLATLFAGIEGGDAATAHRMGALAQHLGLPEQADLLLAAATASVQPPHPPATAAPRTPLDPATLATLEEALGSADLSRFARRRPVCAMVPGEGLKLAWETRVLSLTELAETLVPGFDLEAAPWLFRRLTRILDLRMMALLAAPQELDRARPFALRLNIASILSPAFLRFDSALPSRLRGKVVIALRPEDVLADPPAFLFARGFAHARGFRLLLGGLTQLLAPAFPAEPGGFDHLELAWDPVLDSTTLARLGLPAERVVLCGVDSAAAMDWARGQGITLVTGPFARPG